MPDIVPPSAALPRLALPDRAFAAYLFDCDGTIVESMPLHYTAWTQVLARWGATFDERQFYAWAGRPTSEIIAALNAQQGLAMPVDEVLHEKEALYVALLPELQGIPKVMEHIERGHGHVRFAVVSGGPRASVVASLEALHILDKFETLVCAGDYTRGKPDPEPFLVAAARLGVAPADCLVFEDADFGIQSAAAAGMAWVKVAPPWERVR
ncbi:MAG TPA: HAD family phosphatase [Kofleriaceae bacterium]